MEKPKIKKSKKIVNAALIAVDSISLWFGDGGNIFADTAHRAAFSFDARVLCQGVGTVRAAVRIL
jgi:hypothetical protein